MRGDDGARSNGCAPERSRNGCLMLDRMDRSDADSTESERTFEILDLSEPPSLDQGHIERTRCFVDELVHMLSRHHQRRRNDHGVAYCPHDQTIADTHVATERAHFTRIGKGLSLILIT